MRIRSIAALIAAITALSQPVIGQTYNPHPRIWLTPSLVSEMQALRANNDPLWTNFKTVADSYLGQTIYTLTPTAATNSSPVQFTTTETVHCSGDYFYLGGLVDTPGHPGGWSTLNNVSTGCTKVDDHHFTLANGSGPIDSTGWGSITGISSVTIWTGSACWTNMVCYPYEGFGWLFPLEHLSLAYVVSGDTVYSDQAKLILDNINSFTAAGITGPIKVDGGFASRTAVLGVGLAADWLDPVLSSTEKTAIWATLNAWYDECRLNGCYSWTANWPSDNYATNNYWGGYVVAGAIAALATGENSGGNPRASEIYNHWLTQWNNNQGVFSTSTTPPGPWSTGWFIEGSLYGTGNSQRILEFLNAVKTATGTDLGVTNLANAFENSSEYLLLPDRWRGNIDQEQSSICAGVVSSTLTLELSHLLAGTTKGEYAQWLYNHKGALPAGSIADNCTAQQQGSGVGSDSDLLRLLYYRASRTATDYRLSDPNYYYSPGTGMGIWRSDWTDNAQWFSFFASPYYATGKYNLNAGHFDITRGSDQLLVTGNYWSDTTGVYGSPKPDSPDLPGNYWQNTLAFDDGGAYTYYNTVGGQGYWGGRPDGAPSAAWSPTTSPLPQVKITATSAYFCGDETSGYDRQPGDRTPANRTLRYWFRCGAALPGGSYIFFDRALAKSSSYAKGMLFHLSPEGTPSIASGVISNVVGSSKVYIKPLQVSNSSGVSTVAITQSVDSGGSTYKETVADTASDAQFNLLTLVYATSSSGSLPAATVLTSSANAVAAQVNDTVPVVFVQGTPVVDNGNNTYSTPGQSSVTFTSTHAGIGNYTVGGLVRNSGFDVILGGLRINTLSTGDEGMIAFTSTSGSFQVQRGYSVSSNPNPLPSAIMNAGFPGADFVASGGVGGYTYAVSSGALPLGLIMNSAGHLSGTATQQGSFNFTVTATDSGLATTSTPFVLVVSQPGIPTLAITTASLAGGSQSNSYTQLLAATGGNGVYNWNLAGGALPPGLNLSGSGSISGVPTTAGTFAFIAQVLSGDGQAAQHQFSLTIGPATAASVLSGVQLSGVTIK